MKKIKPAVTDSGTDVRRAPETPGVSNLMLILAAVRGTTPDQADQEFNGSGYGAFKQAVADAVVDYLAPVRERYNEVRADDPERERILTAGPERAREIAAPTMLDARRAMGVGPVR